MAGIDIVSSVAMEMNSGVVIWDNISKPRDIGHLVDNISKPGDIGHLVNNISKPGDIGYLVGNISKPGDIGYLVGFQLQVVLSYNSMMLKYTSHVCFIYNKIVSTFL